MPEKKRVDKHRKKPINSRMKGKYGELELVKVLNELLGIRARRGRQYCGLDGSPDVVLQQEEDNGELSDIKGLHVECKRVECFNLYEALSQSIRDAREGEIPVVCHRRNHKPWVIVFELNRLKDVAEWVKSLEDIDVDAESGSD